MSVVFRLHHLGILVEDIQSAAERLAQRYGYLADSPVIEDPQQTARVQFLRLPGDRHWTELVSPSGAESLLQGALDRRRGGVHHMCYEVADIEAACRELRSTGMLLVSRPVPGVAFANRPIAWLMDRDNILTELVEAGAGPLALGVAEPK